HWKRFCESFDPPALGADPRLAGNAQRIAARDWMIPRIAEALRQLAKAEIIARCVAANIPVAPVNTVADLVADPHLEAGGGLLDVVLPGGVAAKLPRLPVAIGAHALGLIRQAPEIG